MIGETRPSDLGPVERVLWVARMPDPGVEVFVPGGGVSRVVVYRLGLACEDEMQVQVAETSGHLPKIGDWCLCPARDAGLCKRQQAWRGGTAHGGVGA